MVRRSKYLAAKTRRSSPNVSRKTRKRARKTVKRYRTKRATRRATSSWGALGRSAWKYGPGLARGIAKLTGYGDYSAKSIMGGEVPMMSNVGPDTIVNHREFIGDIQSTVGFVASAFYINPGNSFLFPWLSNIARNFEEWVPMGIVFTYKTSSSNTVVNVSTGSPSLGTVTMATDYNCYNPTFQSKQQMENYQWSKSGDPSTTFTHGIETDRKANVMKQYYVTEGNELPNAGDARMYFPGVFQIATVGNSVNSVTNQGNNIGELWVSYNIKLKKPKIPSNQIQGTPGNGVFDHFNFNQFGANLTSIKPSTPFGTSVFAMIAPTNGSTLKGAISAGAVPIADQTKGYINNSYSQGYAPFPLFNPSGVQVIGAANTYYFPREVIDASFLFHYYAKYFSIASTTAMTLTAFNCVPLNIFNNNSASYTQSTDSVSVSTCITYAFRVIGPGAYVTMTGAVVATGATSFANLYVSEMPNSAVV